MKNIKPILLSAALLLSSSSFANDDKHKEGEKLFKSICASCHGIAVGGMDMNKRIAPPIAGVRKHYLDAYPNKAKFVAAITNWVGKQDESKSLMRGAIRKFKIMPPISVPQGDVEKIAAYIYSGNIEVPEHLGMHMEKMHGKMGEHKSMDHSNDADHKNMMAGMKQNKMAGKRGMKGMMRKLGLSSQQKQKMKVLIQEKNKIMQPLKKQYHQIKQEIHQLDTTSSNYKKQIFALADKKSKLVFRMAIEKGEKRMQIESVLNTEQKAKFKQIRQQRFEKRQRH